MQLNKFTRVKNYKYIEKKTFNLRNYGNNY